MRRISAKSSSTRASGSSASVSPRNDSTADRSSLTRPLHRTCVRLYEDPTLASVMSVTFKTTLPADDPGRNGYAYEPRADEPASMSDTITPSGSAPQ